MSRLLIIALLAGCGGNGGSAGGGDGPAIPEPAPGDSIQRKTVEGPVIAEVSLSPATPRLGDPLTLILHVEAEPGVAVEMPDFGEALGRFTIVRFTPVTRRRPDGGTSAEQRYLLQAPMSGRQRIPQLRVEFIDERKPAGGDAGVAEVRELLTDELPVQIASTLADGEEAGRLATAPQPLEPPRQRHPLVRIWPLYPAVALAGAGLWLLLRGRRLARRRRRIDAWAWARQRLAALEAAGMPTAEQADAWWVELSAVVRSYIEHRFGIRAPELTTEEFLREAGRAAALAPEHRELLARFLADCDRVKFAGHHPDADESRAALAAARRFVDDTRVQPEAAAAPGPAGPAEAAAA